LKMPNLLTFMDFPPAIRQSLYSTNLIENFNKHLKRTTHRKEQFPTEDSLDRFLVSQFNAYNEKSLKRIHRGFKGLQDRSEEHTSELQSRFDLVCRLLLEKKNYVY